jgi:allantoinase
MADPGYPRDVVGYGPNPPHADWPGGARVALQFVLNYEEGGESCVLHGDAASEQFLSEIIGAPAHPARHLSVESIYEYGSRAGVWRILREFERRALPLTVFAVAMALERNPEATAAFVAHGHEIACHGWRWIDYQNVEAAVEREHMRIGVDVIRRLTGAAPLGWYTGRDSPNTRRLVVEHGGFLYDSDYYGDDLPFWTEVRTADGAVRPHLVVPYALDSNDMRFATPQGFHTGEQFFAYLRDAFDVLYAEGGERPRMLSIGMHCRLLGRPGRFAALQRFLDHVARHDRVWVCRRADIARHWVDRHPFVPRERQP